MMQHGAHIPLSGLPFLHDPQRFRALPKQQRAAALEVIYQFVKEGKVLGPFPGHTRSCPISGRPLYFYPSFVVPKSKPGSYRQVLNASHSREGPSVNDRITDFSTTLVGVKESLVPCLRTQFMSRLDLRRAFKQLFRRISELHLLATVVDEFVFIDATMSMGLRNTCKLFEEDFMKAFVKGLVHHHPRLFSDALGHLVNNYLDDIQFLADSREKNMLQLLVAEWWADWLGIQLNHEKRELPCSHTRHLGFMVDLFKKAVFVTCKHKSRVLNFFALFLKTVRLKKRIRLRAIQKMLGLQIQIGTVFRVTRQFLTSTCDIIRATGNAEFFYPRRFQLLTARAIIDLKFWRRFITSSPSAHFDYILNHLPYNVSSLSCDASTGFGMAGVLLFNKPNASFEGFHGLFWQSTWEDQYKIHQMDDLVQGRVRIHVAEFLAALITFETFAPYCENAITTLSLDNSAAKAWLDAARCTRYPFDRCAQGIHLFMMGCNMKVSAKQIPSEENTLADILSREKFSGEASGHMVANFRLRKVRPKWHNVIKLL